MAISKRLPWHNKVTGKVSKMTHTKAIQLLTLILKGDDPKSNPDYLNAIRVALEALKREMLLGIEGEK